ncbi:phage holin family protein [Faecalibacter sp. LW9]|uniref:phage holin family protein n=1 Tax=Faecalibacter sp. LW9 TaxID=3103144 RepID=UPI002B000B40|nr:phage holin family protein [Faecalibacter sp. LW9]
MFRDLKTYINQRITLAKYDIVDSTSNMLAGGIYVLILAVSLLFLILLGSIAAGFLLGNYFDNNGLGFLAVTGSYFLFLILCIVFRNKLKLMIANIAVQNAMSALINDEDDDEDDEE